MGHGGQSTFGRCKKGFIPEGICSHCHVPMGTLRAEKAEADMKAGCGAIWRQEFEIFLLSLALWVDLETEGDIDL